MILQKFYVSFVSVKKGLKTDKFALASTVWNKFIVNNQNCYILYNITVD